VAITPPLELPERPSIAVLPFTNFSTDPNQEYFADGITEDLITDLSKISGLFVIARHSTFAYKGRTLRTQGLGRELGVRYLLEGSVRRAGTRVRITTELSEAGTGGSVWAERYDRELRDLFDLQDEITRRIVEELEVTLTQGEQVRVWRRATRNPRAYDLFLRARERWFRLKREYNLEARELAQRAVEEDPEAVGALVIVGLTYMQEVLTGWTVDRPGALQRAVEFARRAIAIDDMFPESHLVLAYVHCLLGQHDEGIKLAETAGQLGPNSADIAAGLADLYNLAGRPEEALTTIRRAMRLSPRYPSYYLSVLGHAYRLSQRFDEALAAYQLYLKMEPENRRVRPNLAIIYVQLGREADARAQAAEVLRRNPRFSLQRWAQATPYKNAEDLERDLDALGRAGFS
jgi:adenylate cyclase